MRRPRATYANVAATLALAVAMGSGTALAAGAWSPSGVDGALHGCYQKVTGNLRLTDPVVSCRNDELAVVWNRSGQPGAAGPAGAPGAVGPQGPPAAVRYAHFVWNGAGESLDEPHSSGVTAQVTNSTACLTTSEPVVNVQMTQTNSGGLGVLSPPQIDVPPPPSLCADPGATVGITFPAGVQGNYYVLLH